MLTIPVAWRSTLFSAHITHATPADPDVGIFNIEAEFTLSYQGADIELTEAEYYEVHKIVRCELEKRSRK